MLFEIVSHYSLNQILVCFFFFSYGINYFAGTFYIEPISQFSVCAYTRLDVLMIPITD